MTTDVTLYRGLKDVYLDTTESSFIDGEAGRPPLSRLQHPRPGRRSPTSKRSATSSCTASCPTKAELEAFHKRLVASRALPPQVIEVIKLVKKAHPMDVLRTAVSAARRLRPRHRGQLAARPTSASRSGSPPSSRPSSRPTTASATATTPFAPRNDLGHAANFLYMLDGSERSEDAVAAIDLDFLLHAEHGANASAFAARVTASTLSDLHSAIVTAIGTLKGPLHGGAAEAVQKMTEEIGEPENAEEYIRKQPGRQRPRHGLRPPRLPRRRPARPPHAREVPRPGRGARPRGVVPDPAAGREGHVALPVPRHLR